MSSVVENSMTKRKCQIFTPTAVVKNMLDYLDYKDKVYGKKILESSCGDGQFLIEIVERYITACRKNNMPDAEISRGLSTDIYGIELDRAHFDTCLKKLNEISKNYHLEDVEWQIYNRDALRHPIREEFDFIVGNPPYVSYWDMDEAERVFVKEKYSVCDSGACDYSYAFIQECLSQLNSTGKFSYIVPNSLFKTRSGKKLRSLLLPHLVAIYDYTTTQLFKGVLTTPAIFVVDKAIDSEKILYKDVSIGSLLEIETATLGDTWIFNNDSATVAEGPKRRFGDYFNVALSIATQRNKAFVLSGWNKKGDYLYRASSRIELDAVKVAASPKNKKMNKREYIIFPYRHENGQILGYNEEDYKNQFPNAYNHLSEYKIDLGKRDSDKSAQWFEYGRSQALKHIWQKKLLTSTLITGSVHVYELDDDEVPYSGLYITVKSTGKSLTLENAKEILESQEFLRYAQMVGISASGKSVRITPSNICDYRW